MRHLIAVLLGVVCADAANAAAGCSARSEPDVPTIVELYTSEGCNSCPPADAWLSTLKNRAGVLPIAFHVDYWDRLGWKDRFASAAHTTRQQRVQQATGARFIYTPQVVVDGRDWRRWPELPAQRPAAVDIELGRDGSRVEAAVAPRAGVPAKLAGYWVSLEDGHSSAVRAGENAGVTLHHDAVVRSYRELPAWSGSSGAMRLTFEPPATERGSAAAVALVVVDAATLRPVGAAKLRGC